MRWLLIFLLGCMGCAPHGFKASPPVSGDYSDAERMSLAKRMERHDFVVAAARQYVEVIRKHQSPLLEEKALVRLEDLIRNHDLSPTLIAIGLLGDTGASARPGNDFLAYLEIHRSQREAHGAWAKRVYEEFTPGSYWSNRMRLDEVERLMGLGFFKQAKKKLEELAPGLEQMKPKQQVRYHRSRARVAYAAGEFGVAIDILGNVDEKRYRTIDDIERAWAHLQLGQTGRALGLGWAADQMTDDPIFKFEIRVLRTLGWLDTCNAGLADLEIAALEQMLIGDVSKLQEGEPARDLEWARRFAEAAPQRSALAQLRYSIAKERAKGEAYPVVLDALEGLTRRLDAVFEGSEELAYRDGATVLLERYGQIQWMKHQAAFVRPGGPRPAILAAKGPRSFSATGVQWRADVSYVQDGELWTDELETLGILGADQCK